MWTQKPSFRFEIDNFSEKEAAIASQIFVGGGCEWSLHVHPKGDSLCDDHLSLYLSVANRKLLRTGWKRIANYYFVVLNQSDKELYRSTIGHASRLFCAETPSWGFPKTLPLSKFQEKGLLEKDKLIIEVYIKIVEAFDGEAETVDINGFQVFASQVTSVRKIFAEHPDIADDFKAKNQAVKTAYMNVLLNLIKKLHKPPNSLSETKLSKACSELSELMNVGFKLDWLKLKLEELSLEKQKADADASRVQQLEERVKNLELIELGFKLDCLNTKLEEVSLADEARGQQLEERVTRLDRMTTRIVAASLARKELDDADEARSQQLEKRVKNLELMELGLKLDSLNSKLEEASLERKKSDDADEARGQQLEERVTRLDRMTTRIVAASLERKKSDDADKAWSQQLEKRVKNLELMELGFKLDCLNSKLEEASLERKKSDDADEARAQQLEERVKNLELIELGLKLDCLNAKLEEVSLADEARAQQLEERVKNFELMVSYLKVELDKKKNKSCADGFLLVDEVA